ncbi:MAG: hypothetical protein AAGA56_00990 [Myxococcota bacterium]
MPIKTTPVRYRLFLLGLAAVTGAQLGVAACDSNTGGKPIEVGLAFSPPDDSDLVETGQFTNRYGWNVRLEEANIALGAVYFNESPALSAQLEALLLPRAYAHPGHGHFAGGEVRAEWLGQTVYNALRRTPLNIGSVPGVAGAIQSWTLFVEPPRDGEMPGAGALRGFRAYVVGVAERGEDAIAFEGGLELLDEKESDTLGVLFEGLPLEATLDEGQRISIIVDARTWLDEAQFETLLDEEDGTCLETSEDGRCEITPGGQVHNAWEIGMTVRTVTFDARVEPVR